MDTEHVEPDHIEFDHTEPALAGTHPPDRPAGGDERGDVVVVGGGIAGLCAALTAAKRGLRVVVLESNAWGGRAKTVERQGFSYNVGPHALYLKGALSGLLGDHHIAIDGNPPPIDSTRVVRDGAAHPMGTGPKDLLTSPLLSRRNRVRLIRLFIKVQRTKPATLVGRSVDDWLGDEPLAVRQFVDMFIRLSTYTNAPGLFDAGAALAQVQLALSGGVTYPHHGWQTIVDALAGAVRAVGGTLRDHTPVDAIERVGQSIEVRSGEHRWVAGAVVMAAGGPDLVERITGSKVGPRNGLTEPIRAGVLDLALRRPVPGILLGLDTPMYLSAHAPLARLAPEGHGLVSVLRYHDAEGSAASSESCRDELRHLAGLGGIDDGDIVHERYLHELVVAHGAPTAAGGGLAGRPNARALGVDGVFLAGDWVGDVGLLADASAASGQRAAQLAAEHVAKVTV
jgi:glycine/D-amino acid oxidase-like deaminating enzyme